MIVKLLSETTYNYICGFLSKKNVQERRFLERNAMNATEAKYFLPSEVCGLSLVVGGLVFGNAYFM
jgi:hypothetical protein